MTFGQSFPLPFQVNFDSVLVWGQTELQDVTPSSSESSMFNHCFHNLCLLVRPHLHLTSYPRLTVLISDRFDRFLAQACTSLNSVEQCSACCQS